MICGDKRAEHRGLMARPQSLEQPSPTDPKSTFPSPHLCRVPGAAQLQVRDRKGIRNPRDLVQNQPVTSA